VKQEFVKYSQHLWLACILLVSFITISCDNDSSTCAPIVPSGTIAGLISHGAADVEIEIHVETAFPQDDISGSYRMNLSAMDTFEITVPEGEYILNARFNYEDYSSVTLYYSNEMGCTFWQDADTVRVMANETVRADFVTGSATLTLAIPGVTDIEEIRLEPVVANSSKFLSTRSYVESSNGIYTFHFPDLPPVPLYFAINLDQPNSERTFYLPQAAHTDSAQIFNILPRTESSYSVDISQQATISGTINGSWQDLGASAPLVSLYSVQSGRRISRATTDDLGNYTANMFAPESLQIRVDVDHISNWIGGSTVEGPTIYVPEFGAPITDANHLESGFRVDVSDPANDEAQSFYLEVYTAEDLGYPVARRRRTFSPQLTANISNLDPGEYCIRIAHSSSRFSVPWYSQWYPGVDDIAYAEPVTIDAAGSITDLSFNLSPGGVIQIWGEHEPTYEELYVNVVIYTAGDSLAVGYLTAEKTGTYEFLAQGLGLSDGEYKIALQTHESGCCSHMYSETLWFPGTPDWHQAEIITIENHESVPDLYMSHPLPLPLLQSWSPIFRAPQPD
jgi:hypothetical protein